MSKLLSIKKIYDLVICAALIGAMISLAMFPEQSVQAARDGLTLCVNVIIPSLFPFFVLSSLMMNLGISRYFGKVLEPVMRPLFNVPGECSAALVLGFVGGYPVGAKTALTLYESGSCTKDEAERLLSFCNNSGPAFILGVVGAGIFSSSKIGLMLYLAHFMASIIVGIIFRSWGKTAGGVKKRRQGSFKAVRFSEAFVDSVKSSVTSTLSICGFVIFFTVIIRLLFLSGIIPGLSGILGAWLSGMGLDPDLAEGFFTGIIELSSGVWSLKEISGQIQNTVAMAAFMLGWAGISVHCQVLSFIGGSGLSVRSYILGKFLHGGISAGITYMLTRIFPLDSPVASYLAEQVTGLSSLDFSTAILISGASALILWAAFVLVAIFSAKNTGNRRGNRI